MDVCPVRNKSQARLKAINMMEKTPILEREKANWDFFAALPETDRRKVRNSTIRQPLGLSLPDWILERSS